MKFLSELMKELKEKLASAEKRRFFHEMKDSWDRADFDYAKTMDMYIADLEERIESLEKEMRERK